MRREPCSRRLPEGKRRGGPGLRYFVVSAPGNQYCPNPKQAASLKEGLPLLNRIGYTPMPGGRHMPHQATRAAGQSPSPPTACPGASLGLRHIRVNVGTRLSGRFFLLLRWKSFKCSSMPANFRREADKSLPAIHIHSFCEHTLGPRQLWPGGSEIKKEHRRPKGTLCSFLFFAGRASTQIPNRPSRERHPFFGGGKSKCYSLTLRKCCAPALSAWPG